MSSLDQLAKRLSDFGITFNQARVYITAAQMGIASIKEISKKSNVPREEIYRLLPKLEKLGLLEKILGKPIKVKATPFGAVLSLLIKREKDMNSQRLSKLKAEKGKLLKDMQKLEIKNDSEGKAHFTLISHRDAIIQKIFSMIDTAEKTVDLAISRDQFIHFFTSHMPLIKKNLSRGLNFRVVLEKCEYDDSVNTVLKEFSSSGLSFSVRFVDQQLNSYFVVDYKEALVATSMKSVGLGNLHHLWTDESNLVELIAKNFEVTWSSSENEIAVKDENADQRLILALNSLKPTNHVVFFYGSLEAKYNVLCNFLKIGLENGEAVAYIVSEEDLGNIRETMKRFGIDVDKSEKKGALRILGYNEYYFVDGKFNIQTTNRLFKKMYDNALKKGFMGFRIFGETACFFHKNRYDELIEIERTAKRTLDLPIIAMCAYNLKLFDKARNPIDLYNELIKTHSIALYSKSDKHLGKLEIREAYTI